MFLYLDYFSALVRLIERIWCKIFSEVLIMTYFTSVHHFFWLNSVIRIFSSFALFSVANHFLSGSNLILLRLGLDPCIGVGFFSSFLFYVYYSRFDDMNPLIVEAHTTSRANSSDEVATAMSL